MSLLKKFLVLFFLVNLNAPVNAAVGDIEIGFCGIYSEADESKDEKDEGAEEEEPDCE